jgi:hypothetical protein
MTTPRIHNLTALLDIITTVAATNRHIAHTLASDYSAKALTRGSDQLDEIVKQLSRPGEAS